MDETANGVREQLEPVMRRYRVVGSFRTGLWFVLDCVGDEYVTGPVCKRDADMLADRLEHAVLAGIRTEGER